MLASPYSLHTSRPVVLGIIGGGQLAKMTAQAAYSLGLGIAVIEHGADSPAGTMTKHEFTNGWTDPDELQRFIDISDIITLENEFVNPDILRTIAERRLVFPNADTVALVQDKLTQKKTFTAAGIPMTTFEELNSPEQAADFGKKHGFPYIIKTRTLGYDGYGNITVRSEQEAIAGYNTFTQSEEPRQVMAEQFVRFTAELAVMVARNRRGEHVIYPCVETIQENHICRVVIAPARCSTDIHTKAQQIALACVEAIKGVGVFGVEMFLTESGDVLFNEIAPRPHNSGHYTIEACHCSQFENAVRAVNNLPLGSPAMLTKAAVMVNILGERPGSGVPDSITPLLRHPETAFHLYGKKDSRKGRKMGHLTVVGHDTDTVLQQALAAANDLIW
jgi:5-(carboxyamino)imidazole ribonucleotide synthase